MKTLLTIGYSHFVLPASANVNAIIAVLNKATPVRHDYQNHKSVYYPELKREFDIKIELISDDAVIDTRKLKALPEHASEDAHNTF